MASTQDILSWRGQTLVDRSGDKIGSIDEIYEDTETGQAEWALVHTGLFGTKSTFVPLREASATGGGVSVPFDKAQVKDAPSVEQEGQLSRDEEARLYSHYGIDYGTDRSDSGLPESGAGTTGTTGMTDRDTVGHDTSGPTTDNAMTRSEEELRVGTQQVETGRARLRKYIVTENVEVTVPIQREEVRIEREAITDANIGNALDGPALSEEEHEVILHEERPVVQKDVVAKERIRLDKDVVTEQQRVSETVRKEQIEVEGADDVGTRGRTDAGMGTGVGGRTGGDMDPQPTGERGGTARGGLTGDRTSMDETGTDSPGVRDRKELGVDNPLDDAKHQAP